LSVNAAEGGNTWDLIESFCIQFDPATCYNQPGLRMFTDQAPNQLSALLVALTSDGTGIDNDEVRRPVEHGPAHDRQKSTSGELTGETFAIVAIHLAPQRLNQNDGGNMP